MKVVLASRTVEIPDGGELFEMPPLCKLKYPTRRLDLKCNLFSRLCRLLNCVEYFSRGGSKMPQSQGNRKAWFP